MDLGARARTEESEEVTELHDDDDESESDASELFERCMIIRSAIPPIVLNLR